MFNCCIELTYNKHMGKETLLETAKLQWEGYSGTFVYFIVSKILQL